jgi:recombinational DNA repair protein RecT
MQTTTAMNSDVKALLTLWLLKMGTSSQEIQTTLQLAAASRVMVAEEQAPLEEDGPQAASNVALLRSASEVSSATARHDHQTARAMHSDIKALLALSLLKIGTSTIEIQTTLRMAASARAEAAEEAAAAAAVEAPAPAPEKVRAIETPSQTPRQALRNAHLAPISMRQFAAA